MAIPLQSAVWNYTNSLKDLENTDKTDTTYAKLLSRFLYDVESIARRNPIIGATDAGVRTILIINILLFVRYKFGDEVPINIPEFKRFAEDFARDAVMASTETNKLYYGYLAPRIKSIKNSTSE